MLYYVADSFSLHRSTDNNCVDYEKLSGFP
jgi:hypothetical protein